MITPYRFVTESLRIENILRPPRETEMNEFDRFMHLEEVTLADLLQFVEIYQPNAKLRNVQGRDVIIGDYIPPAGGPLITGMLDDILDDADDSMGLETPFDIHVRYERLHPFTDCNGRSGRMLWAWHMGMDNAMRLPFLQQFYYQTLKES